MNMESLHDLLIDELTDLYDAENQILKALPKMVKAASSEELQSAFEEHLEVTKKQVQRLDQAFAMLNKTPKRKKCKGMEGLLEEGKEKMEEDADPEVLDAGLIVGAQKVEHYEIAGYGSARTFAHVLGKSKVAALLQQSLAEEAEADKKLTQIAQEINMKAAEDKGHEESGQTSDRRPARSKTRAA